MINVSISVTSYNVEDKVEYLTAYDFLDADFIQNLIDELHSNEINL